MLFMSMEQIKEAVHKLGRYESSEIFLEFSEHYGSKTVKYLASFNALIYSTDALNYFRALSAPANLAERYLVIFGALQAFVIQQDAIWHLHKHFVDVKGPVISKDTAWMQLRDLRKTVVGHPAVRNHISSIKLPMGVSEWGIQGSSKNTRVDIHPFILSLLPQYEVEMLEIMRVIDDAIKIQIDHQSR